MIDETEQAISLGQFRKAQSKALRTIKFQLYRELLALELKKTVPRIRLFWCQIKRVARRVFHPGLAVINIRRLGVKFMLLLTESALQIYKLLNKDAHDKITPGSREVLTQCREQGMRIPFHAAPYRSR